MNDSKSTKFACAALSLLALGACAAEGDESPWGPISINDAEDAEQDGKSDGASFGVEEDAPDAQAVLKIANTFSKAKLKSAGVSEAVAKRIVDARTANGAFMSLAQFDQVPYVGASVFGALRWHATKNGLYPTSLRIPLLDDNGNPLSELNPELIAAGQAPVPEYVWIGEKSYEQVRDSMQERIDHLEMPIWVLSTGALLSYSETPDMPDVCWVGNPWKVTRLLEREVGVLLSEGYEALAWRVGTKTSFEYLDLDEEIDVELAAQIDSEPEWNQYSTTSNTVLIALTDSDSGETAVYFDRAAACRNPHE